MAHAKQQLGIARPGRRMNEDRGAAPSIGREYLQEVQTALRSFVVQNPSLGKALPLAAL